MKNLTCIFFATLFLSACRESNNIQLINAKATLPASFKFDALGLKFITATINKRAGTTSVLYGNPVALAAAFKGTEQLPGKVLAMVTWAQQDDPYWFGGKIAGILQSVELVKTSAEVTCITTSYTRYIGKGLTMERDTLKQQERINHIVSLQPSIMP